MSEVDCSNCNAACCRGPLVVSLTLEEASFMLRGGNKLVTVAQPEEKDRKEVIYPLAAQRSAENSDGITWVLNPDNPYEPLAAGLGRYILLGDCAYLETTEEGWERCSVYEDRPAVCRDFEMGSRKCLIFRARHGISDPVEMTER